MRHVIPEVGPMEWWPEEMPPADRLCAARRDRARLLVTDARYTRYRYQVELAPGKAYDELLVGIFPAPQDWAPYVEVLRRALALLEGQARTAHWAPALRREIARCQQAEAGWEQQLARGGDHVPPVMTQRRRGGPYPADYPYPMRETTQGERPS